MAQSKLSIVEAEHHDEITLNWTIPNFKALYAAAKASNVARFVEEKFTLKGKGKSWGLLLSTEDEKDYIGIYLEFSGQYCSSAEFTVYLKSSEGKFVNTYDMELHKYAPDDSDIKDATESWGEAEWKTLEALQTEGFLTDDTLQLKLIVRVYSRKTLLKTTVAKDLKKGFDSGLGSDVIFIFLEEEGSQNVIGEIKAHKAILSLRSSVFAGMFGIGMKEALEGEVEISDMTPKAMRILLNFIYSGEVDEEWATVAEELFYGAHKYDLAELQTYLCENVDPVLTVENVMKIRNLATLYELPDVLESTLNFIKGNAKEFFENHDVIFKNKK